MKPKSAIYWIKRTTKDRFVSIKAQTAPKHTHLDNDGFINYLLDILEERQNEL